MENLSIVHGRISKLFISLGIIGLLISTIDIFDIILPLHVSSPEWIFNITQSFVNSLLAPVICIILLLSGIYLIGNSTKTKNILLYQQIISLITLLFGILITINLLFYSLSMKSYEIGVISNIKYQSEEISKKLDQVYEIQKSQIPEKFYKEKVNEIKQKTNSQIKQAKKTLLRKNIKIIIEMVLYITLYFLIAVFSFQSAKNDKQKLKFSAN